MMTEDTNTLAYEDAPDELLKLLAPPVRDFLDANGYAQISPATAKTLASRMVRAYQKRTADRYGIPASVIEAATAFSKALDAKADVDYHKQIVDYHKQIVDYHKQIVDDFYAKINTEGI